MKEFIKELRKKPEIICAPETQLKPAFDFVIKGYTFRKEREDGRINKTRDTI